MRNTYVYNSITLASFSHVVLRHYIGSSWSKYRLSYIDFYKQVRATKARDSFNFECLLHNIFIELVALVWLHQLSFVLLDACSSSIYIYIQSIDRTKGWWLYSASPPCVCITVYRLYTETKLAVFRLFELAILTVGWKANVWNTCRRRRRIRQRGFGFQSSFTKFCRQNEASFRPPRLTEGRVRLLIALQFIRPAISSSDLQVSSRLCNKWTRLSKAARTNKHVLQYY
jgi:hypothetical protein